MTTTNTSNAPGTSYTFDTYGLSFDAADSGVMTFDTAAPNNWTVAVDEAIANAEAFINGFLKPVAEAFATAEARVSDHDGEQSEAFSTSEGNTHVWGAFIAIAEAFATAEALAKDASPAPITEAFATAEALAKGIDDQTAEAFATVEALVNLTTWTRTFTETVAYVDDDAIGYSKAISEAVAFADLLYRNANIVWQEFQVRGAPLTVQDIVSLVGYEAPVGFSPLVDFVAGDYDFQKALFGIIVKASSADERPALQQVDIVADMPDVNDTGTVTIAANGTVLVNFNKKFTVAPSVALAMTTAAQASTAVVIGSPTKNGFTCGLQVSAGVYTTGSLTWTAVGR